MIIFKKGNLFDSDCQTLVNTVNCYGVMGKGIALVFKLRYPEMFVIYKNLCANKQFTIGQLWLYKGQPNAPWVLNFPTKFHWKYPSKIEYLEKGLQKFVDTYKEKGIESIAFPLLGTHNGGLDKQEVLALMCKYLKKCDIPIEIYEYDPLAPDDFFESFKDKWNSIPSDRRRMVMGIRSQSKVDILDRAINGGTAKSMISLISLDGIGIKTMESCFDVVMNYRPENTLFDSES